MSITDRINGMLGTRSTLPLANVRAAMPAGDGTTAADAVQARFDDAFSTSFTSSMSTIFEQAAAGEFDDPELAKAEADALERLERFRHAAAIGQGLEVGGEVVAAVTGTDATTPAAATGPEDAQGADAAPAGAPGAPGAPGASTGTGAAAAPPAAAPATGSAATDDAGSAWQLAAGVATGVGSFLQAEAGSRITTQQRTVLELRVQQAEARVQRVSQSLRGRYAAAASLPSASTGQLDPSTFVPRTREQAEAFAQRMAVDVTEAAARLDVIERQVELAELDAATGAAGAEERLAELHQARERQRAWVAELGQVVDRLSGGGLAESGRDVLAGMRSATIVPGDEDGADMRAMADGMRTSGIDEEDVLRVVGATDIAREEAVEADSGGSDRLDALTVSMTDAALMLWEQRNEAAERRSEAEAERVREQRRDDERLEQQRLQAQRAETARGERQEFQAAQDARSLADAQRFAAWMRQLEAEQAAASQARGA